ncbi:MAG TPA: histidine--tRNA ligase [Candidatus Marinimicrobia bacterium]|nr:histidine--tRNA ligase [Candidatus Neomarinimicrobiota bacterium]HRS52412.1 histidine--tRNA ligase [Candidatus Neomarinimicrobiota bacterium]
MLYQRVKGTRDILPSEVHQWQFLENFLREYFKRNNYKEIRTPAFEVTELFTRSIGGDTDVVSKEMYTFLDKGGTSITLKPELTAPVMRAYIQNNLEQIAPLTKLYYIDSLFRQERPQKGRLRQFHQFGFEIIGSPHPEADAETIQTVYELYRELGLTELNIRLNSIGDRLTRGQYLIVLRNAIEPYHNELCGACQERLHKNVLRLFDCKVEICQQIMAEHAPSILDYLSNDDRLHFQKVCHLLDVSDVPYTIDQSLVRGLDYYTRTTFEITSPLLGAQDALCGGGRYDHLIEDLGGQPTPGVGVASGIERLLLVMEQVGSFPKPTNDLVYVITMSENSRTAGFRLVTELRRQKINAQMDFLRRSIKAQLRDADREQANWVVIIGEDEISRNMVIFKDMENGEQRELPLKTAADQIVALLQNKT